MRPSHGRLKLTKSITAKNFIELPLFSNLITYVDPLHASVMATSDIRTFQQRLRILLLMYTLLKRFLCVTQCLFLFADASWFASSRLGSSIHKSTRGSQFTFPMHDHNSSWTVDNSMLLKSIHTHSKHFSNWYVNTMNILFYHTSDLNTGCLGSAYSGCYGNIQATWVR